MQKKYWALLSNPRDYDIYGSINNRSEDWWPTKGSNIEIGDKVAIWKAKGNESNRGIIALGVVVVGPQLRDTLNDPFWIRPNKNQEAQKRVKVRYLRYSNLPLWLSKHSWLGNLNCAKARGGIVFHIAKSQWEIILSKAGDEIITAGSLFKKNAKLIKGRGESERHKNLKNYIAERPELIGLPGNSTSDKEHIFITGDRVDILFYSNSEIIAVVEIELEGEIQTRIGTHQAYKYQALAIMEGDQADISAILVAYEIPQKIKELCSKHGIDFFEINESKVKRQNISK